MNVKHRLNVKQTLAATAAIGIALVAAVGAITDAVEKPAPTPATVTPAAGTDVDAATIYASPDACRPDYYAGAWHICEATYPAATEDEFAVTYSGGAWHIVYVGDQS